MSESEYASDSVGLVELPSDAPQPTRSSSNTERSTHRRSCNMCTKRKRKCNGDGVKNCDFCLSCNINCVYSVRLKSGRRKRTESEPNASTSNPPIFAHTDSGEGAMYAAMPFSSSLIDSSISMGTNVGLVGYQENYFISLYLSEMNAFLPMTSEITLAQAVQEVVLQPSFNRGHSVTDMTRQAGLLGVFWSAVALGSRIAGSPDVITLSYATRARNALSMCYDSPTTEVPEAFLLLGSLAGIRGHTDQAKMYIGYAQVSHILVCKGARGTVPGTFSEPEPGTFLELPAPGKFSGPQRMFSPAVERSEKIPPESSGSEKVPRSSSENFLRVDAYGTSKLGTLLSILGPRILDNHEMHCYVPTLDVNVEQLVDKVERDGGGGDPPMVHLFMFVGVQKHVYQALDPLATPEEMCHALTLCERTWGAVDACRDRNNVLSAAPYYVWNGCIMIMKGNTQVGLESVKWGMQLAFRYPSCVTFPFWWHMFHYAALALYHFGEMEWFTRVASLYNANTFPSSNHIPTTHAICVTDVCEEGHLCAMFGNWLCKHQPHGALCAIHTAPPPAPTLTYTTSSGGTSTESILSNESVNAHVHAHVHAYGTQHARVVSTDSTSAACASAYLNPHVHEHVHAYDTQHAHAHAYARTDMHAHPGFGGIQRQNVYPIQQNVYPTHVEGVPDTRVPEGVPRRMFCPPQVFISGRVPQLGPSMYKHVVDNTHILRNTHTNESIHRVGSTSSLGEPGMYIPTAMLSSYAAPVCDDNYKNIVDSTHIRNTFKREDSMSAHNTYSIHRVSNDKHRANPNPNPKLQVADPAGMTSSIFRASAAAPRKSESNMRGVGAPFYGSGLGLGLQLSSHPAELPSVLDFHMG